MKQRGLFSFLCLFLVSFFSWNSAATETLRFGIVPQQSAKKLAATWGPIIERLEQESGMQIRFMTAPTIPEFEKRLLAKKYDIAYMNPYHYAVYSEGGSYQVIAKQLDKKIKGIIVVPKTSDIQSIEELSGQRMAFPAPLSFAATLIPIANMKSKGFDVSPSYVKSHDSVYMSVARGFFAAGGGVKRTLSAAPQEVRDQLRILWESPGYTPHAIAVSDKLNDVQKMALSNALVSITDKSLLAPIAFNGFARATDSEWDSIRELQIDAPSDASQ